MNTKLKYSYLKTDSNNEGVQIPNRNHIYDSSEFIWSSSSYLLDYYWSIYYEKYGTNLQDVVFEQDENKMLYRDYLKKSLNIITSNKIGGLVTVDTCEEDDTSWNIETTVPPTTLLNCLRYTPCRIADQDVITSFIIYQIVCAVEELHQLNIPHLQLTLSNIYIDENFIVKLSLPRFNALSERTKDLSNNGKESNKSNVEESQSLNNVLWKWMRGEMSNLEYLLYLNTIAGRSTSDPNNHPMIPWVTDFSERYGGYRDLKVSKFRINKGDEHLDKLYQDQEEELQQYDNCCPLGFNINSDIHKKSSVANKARIAKQMLSMTENTGSVLEYQPSNPHHVSDILSELSYYAYMARVTPIEVLKKYYRSFYNPQEFKWDMAKMYAWSPDECIPQFFTDPSVFRSTHTDMPDIGLPSWCKSPEEFVTYHREILESEEISSNLNHWIDLVFGYKLLGDDAVNSKNVHRQFSERRSSLTNNGLSVLFRKPHPKRLSSNRSLMKYFGSKRPKINHSEIANQQINEGLISLPEDYDPCELIEYYRNYSIFIQDSCSSSAIELKPLSHQSNDLLRTSFDQDIIDICCLIVELFNSDLLRSDYLFSQYDFDLRQNSCTLLYNQDPSKIPLSFRDTIEKVLLNRTDKRPYIPNIFELKRSQKWFIFDKCVVKIFHLTKHIASPHMDTVISLKHFFLGQSEHVKFSNEVLSIITPHLISLLKLDLEYYFDQILDILVCILHRFGLISGRNLIIRDILPPIIKLYPKSKNLVRSKHALLYQRNFLNLLLIRIGMEAFLMHIVGLLVYMLVLGQHIFGSMKESISPEFEHKHSENDSESLFEEERIIPFGDSDISVTENKRSSMEGMDGDSQSVDIPCSPIGSDSTSQCGIEFEEIKTQNSHFNGPIQSSLPTVMDLIPFSDPEIFEAAHGQRNKNGALSKLLTSPFKKRSKSKSNAHQKVTSKVEQRQFLSQDCSKMSLAQLSYSSLVWLADLIGPIEASSKILYELLAQFSLCYQNCDFDEVPSDALDSSSRSLVTGTFDAFVEADREVTTVLECLREFIGLYGLAVVWHQIRHFIDTLLDKSIFISDEMLPNTQTSLICSLSLLAFLSMLIPDEYLEAFLSDKVLDEYLPLIIRTVGNMSQPFPNGKRPRKVLLHKVIDLIYLLSSRLKFDQIKDSMNNIYKLLFGLFSKTFDCNDHGVVIYREVPTDIIESPCKGKDMSRIYVTFLPENNDFTIIPSKLNSAKGPSIKENIEKVRSEPYRTVSVSNREMAFEEMKYVITAELAYVLYISFAKLLGQNKLDSLICNQNVIQALMSHHERGHADTTYSTPDKSKQNKLEESLNFLTNSVMSYRRRHLTDLWKEYWIHELGFCDSEPFDIKQMGLGKFEGHGGIIKGFDVLDCENSFLSYAKDKVVKLYSISDIDYSNVAAEVSSRFSYHHPKTVLDAIFIEQMRIAVSIDGVVHLWDPFTGKKILNSSLGMSNPNWNTVCSILPSQSQIAVANAEGRVQVVDLRSGSSCYSYHLNTSAINSPISNEFPANTGGFIKKIASTSDGNHLIVGNSDGYLNMIDLRMSKLINSWKPHQYEVSQIVFMKNWCVTSSTEPNGRLSLINLGNLSQSVTLHGPDLGSIHSLMILRDQIVVGASQNRFGLFQSVNQYKSLNRLSPSLYKGTVTSASLLLHNRLLLLGSDTGGISLWY